MMCVVVVVTSSLCLNLFSNLQWVRFQPCCVTACPLPFWAQSPTSWSSHSGEQLVGLYIILADVWHVVWETLSFEPGLVIICIKVHKGP